MRIFNDVEYQEGARPAALKALEVDLGVSFAQSFRSFMHRSNGAAFMEDTHVFKAVFATGITFPRLEWIYQIDQIRSQTAIFQGTSTYDGEPNALPPQMVVIGSAVDDTDQGPIILDLRQEAPHPGAVYFRHLTFSSALAGVTWFEALAWVAPHFDGLLDALHRLPE